MGKKNRKNYKNANTNTEREFNEMKERIFSDQKKYNGDHTTAKKPYHNNERKPAYKSNQNEVSENPYEHIQSNTDLFKDMIGDLVSDSNVDADKTGVVTRVEFATKKEENGIVYAVITSAMDGSDEGLSIVVYYLEDRCISPKKANHVNEYTSNILVINEKNHAVLYNRFDIGSKCIYKSDQYIRVMVAKNIDRVKTLNKEKATKEV